MTLENALQQKKKEVELRKTELEKSFNTKSETFNKFLVEAGAIEMLEEIQKLWKTGEINTFLGRQSNLLPKPKSRTLGEASVVLSARWPVFVPEKKEFIYVENDGITKSIYPGHSAHIGDTQELLGVGLEHYSKEIKRNVTVPNLFTNETIAIGTGNWREDDYYTLVILQNNIQNSQPLQIEGFNTD